MKFWLNTSNDTYTNFGYENVKNGDHLNYLDRGMNNREDKIITNTHAMKAYEGFEIQYYHIEPKELQSAG